MSSSFPQDTWARQGLQLHSLAERALQSLQEDQGALAQEVSAHSQACLALHSTGSQGTCFFFWGLGQLEAPGACLEAAGSSSCAQACATDAWGRG